MGNIGETVRKIRSYDKIIYTDYEYKEIARKLKLANITDERVMTEHIRQIAVLKS